MVKYLIRVLSIGALVVSSAAYAGGYSSWATPKNVELVSGGVLIHGEFGDPNNCGKADYIYVSQVDERYDSVLSMSLAALMGQRELRFYASSCVAVGFHWAGSVINKNSNGQAVFIR